MINVWVEKMKKERWINLKNLIFLPLIILLFLLVIKPEIISPCLSMWMYIFLLLLVRFFVLGNATIKKINLVVRDQSSVNIIKNWFFQEEKWYLTILGFIFILSFMVRVWNLGFLSPARDEFTHLVAAKRWAEEGVFNYVRGWEMTYLVGFLFKIFHTSSLAVARSVPVFFGSLTTITIYLLGARMNKETGLISAFLWAFSPFAVGLSQYVREYSIYVFLMTLSAWYLFYFLDNIKEIKFSFDGFLKVIILFLPVLYVFLPEVSMTFKAIFLIYGCSIFIYSVFHWKGLLTRFGVRSLLLKKIGLILILILIFFLSIWSYLPFESRPFNTFFNAQIPEGSWIASQWFLGSHIPSWFLIILFFMPLVLFYQRRDLLSYYSIFLASFFIFSFLLKLVTQDPFGSRMAFYVLPFYILIYAVSIYCFIYFIAWARRRSFLLSLSLVLFLLVLFNPFLSLNLIANEKNGVIDLKQGTPHPDILKVVDILDRSGFRPENPIITTHDSFLPYYYHYDFIKYPSRSKWSLIRFKYHNGKLRYDYPVNVYLLKKERLANGFKTIIKIINNSDKGWIVVEKSIGDNKKLILKILSSTDREIEFLGKVKGTPDFYVYRWE